MKSKRTKKTLPANRRGFEPPQKKFSDKKTGMLNFYDKTLENLKNRGLYRRLRILEGEQNSEVVIDGKKAVQLSSNNYLGLASHPRIKMAAKEAIDRYGCGSGASRLLSGNSKLYQVLEEKLANFKKTAAALVFNTGYMANLGIIQSLTGKGDAIIGDELNHASIIEGCRLSRAEVACFPHKDLDCLEFLLKKAGGARRRLIVTDGIFSMDGDIAPLPGIVKLARKYSSLVMVDDAHATGVLGKKGRGCAEYFGLEKEIDIQMGTLGKALGCFGAYVAGSKKLIDFLVNMSRPLIFTTALPPPVLASAAKAIEIVDNYPELRKNLWEKTAFLKKGLKKSGFNLMESETPIIPVFIGDHDRAGKMGELLLEKGILAPGIRPPTVKRGTARIRVAVMATHSRKNLEQALSAFEETGKILGII